MQDTFSFNLKIRGKAYKKINKKKTNSFQQKFNF